METLAGIVCLTTIAIVATLFAILFVWFVIAAVLAWLGRERPRPHGSSLDELYWYSDQVEQAAYKNTAEATAEFWATFDELRRRS